MLALIGEGIKAVRNGILASFEVCPYILKCDSCADPAGYKCCGTYGGNEFEAAVKSHRQPHSFGSPVERNLSI